MALFLGNKFIWYIYVERGNIKYRRDINLNRRREKIEKGIFGVYIILINNDATSVCIDF